MPLNVSNAPKEGVTVEINVEEGTTTEEMNLDILSGDELSKAVEYLTSEYAQAQSEFETRNQKIKTWRKNMESLQSDAPKTTPFKGAANMNIGVMQMIQQPLGATILGVFTARKPLWETTSVRKNEEEVEKFKVVQKYLNLLAESPTDLNMSVVLEDLVNETTSVGVSFPKVGWRHDTSIVYDEDGTEKEIVWHDGPAITVNPAERIYYRRGIGDIQRLPWISFDYPLTKVELQERGSRGTYDPNAVLTVLDNLRSTPSDLEEQNQEAQYYDTAQTMQVADISEFWFKWDLKGDGIPTGLVFLIHVPTKTVLKQQYNRLGVITADNAKYISRPNSIAGRGIGQLTEAYQAEVTGWHNLRADNAKIANMRMIIRKRPAGSQKTVEIYPGAMIYSDDPSNDYIPRQLGEVYPSSLQAENMGMQYAQRVSGFSDIQAGFADATLRSRDSVRGSAQRLATSNTILSSTIEGLARTIGKLGMYVWLMCCLNKDSVMMKEREAMRLSESELDLLEEALSMDITSIPTRMAFSVKTTDPDKTYEMQRQSMMALTQLYTQFAMQTSPLAQTLFGPQGSAMKQQMPELYNWNMRILVGASQLMTNMFEFFGMNNTQDFVPDMTRWDKVLDSMQSMLQAMQIQNPQQPQQPESQPMQMLMEGQNQPMMEGEQNAAVSGL